MIVCLCEGITERDVEEAAHHGARSLDRLARVTGAGTCCGSCHSALRNVLARCVTNPNSHEHARTAEQPSGATALQR